MPTKRWPRFVHDALVTDRPVRILSAALAELEEAAEWYGARDPDLYDLFLDRYEQRLALALRVPGAGAPAGMTASGIEIRRYRLRKFDRHAILFAQMQDEAVIVAIEHSSRKPGYWKDRLG